MTDITLQQLQLPLLQLLLQREQELVLVQGKHVLLLLLSCLQDEECLLRGLQVLRRQIGGVSGGTSSGSFAGLG